MSVGTPTPRSRTALAVAVLAVVVAGLVVVGVIFNRVAGKDSSPGVASASPSPTAQISATPSPAATPTPAAATIAYADCSKASFGPPLAPLDPPAVDLHKYAAAPPMQIATGKLYEATITTPRGKIVLCLQPALAPITVNNFVALARNHFYDALTFHRVEANFVIQGGDPKGDGTGGAGYSFADEPVHNVYVDGAVAMANSGPNTNGSQFFICTGTQCSSLQPQYNLFGKVQSGLDIARLTQKGDVMAIGVSEQR
ncbi:MAG TPA: peptidylprolyl isomerase [Candidatus Dormibacteraeota bacterium]|jgi:cyclophilin family peptidyl-prolyl cis-trans isomerase|nr:peptidylprolyl isomerase [Candidatus Dormibacteraeota bacterium]